MADDIAEMVAGNRRFKQAFEQDKAYFLSLAEGKQRPKMLWIGCADSRVDPEQIVGASAGDMFVIRNVANVVPPAQSGDDSVGAAIEYCLKHLGVDDIVVCGHTGCGGVKALSARLPQDEGHFGRWIDFARASHQLIEAARVPEADRLQETAKANVLFQQDNLLTYDIVREALERGALRLHGWLYDMQTGDLLAYDEAEGHWHALAARADVPG